MLLLAVSLVSIFIQLALSQNIVLTNDDGWAVAQIRAQDDSLKAAGFDVEHHRVCLKLHKAKCIV